MRLDEEAEDDHVWNSKLTKAHLLAVRTSLQGLKIERRRVQTGWISGQDFHLS